MVTSQPERRRVLPANRPPREPPITIARRTPVPGHGRRDARSNPAVVDPREASDIDG
jgi:hypothetical protein